MNSTWVSGGLAALLLAGLAACTSDTTSAVVGKDAATDSTATVVTWSDGKQAYSVSCDQPSGCNSRVLALCHNGPYTTLKSDNMPSIGTRREPMGAPSVVVRCG